MDLKLALPIPKSLSFQQGATLGVGTYTACLGLLGGLKLEVPDAVSSSTERKEWVVILGGAGSVGQYSVQIAKALGYKVRVFEPLYAPFVRLSELQDMSREDLVKNIRCNSTLDRDWNC